MRAACSKSYGLNCLPSHSTLRMASSRSAIQRIPSLSLSSCVCMRVFVRFVCVLGVSRVFLPQVTSQGQLYPNPNVSSALVGMNEDTLFEFLGKVLGKALAEGVVVQPQFARFFLAKLLHKPTHMHDHLPYLDMVPPPHHPMAHAAPHACPRPLTAGVIQEPHVSPQL